MGGIDVNTSNDIALKKLKDFKSHIVNLINRFNLYIKQDTKNNTKPDIKNNTKCNTKPDTNDDTRPSIKNKEKSIKNKYKSLLETKKTIKNNIDSIYIALKKLPNESQSKLIELVSLDTILNDSINVTWREIHERDKKGIKRIDIYEIKNDDSFIYQLKGIINHKILLLKTSVIVKLNIIISDIKNKSNIDDVYNYNNKDKLFMIESDLDNYMKHLKRDLGSIK